MNKQEPIYDAWKTSGERERVCVCVRACVINGETNEEVIKN